MLDGGELSEAPLGEFEHRVELLTTEWLALGRALQLDELAPPRHDDVEIDLRPMVFRVVEVEQQFAINQTATYRRHALAQDRVDRIPSRGVRFERPRQRDESPGDSQRAGPAIGLQYLAVDRHGSRAERIKIENGPQAAADQPLNFGCASIHLAAFTGFPGRGTGGQHVVLGRQPATRRVFLHPGRQRVFDRCGTEQHRAARFDEHTARRGADEVHLRANGTKFSRATSRQSSRHTSITRQTAEKPSGEEIARRANLIIRG